MNLKENQPDIDKIHFYAKDLYEAKYQHLINKREGVGMNHFNDPKAFIEYSNNMRDLYKNIDEYNSDKKNKILIAFNDIIADMINNKKLDSIVTELFIRGRKLNISLFFITQSYFEIPKDVKLNTTYFYIAKSRDKRELQDIAINHSQILSLKISLISRENVLLNHILFLSNDTTLASSNPLKFRKNIFNILKFFKVQKKCF